MQVESVEFPREMQPDQSRTGPNVWCETATRLEFPRWDKRPHFHVPL